MKKIVTILTLGLLWFSASAIWLTGFSQSPDNTDCHATVFIQRFDVTRFNNDPGLVHLTSQILSRTLTEALGSAVTIVMEPGTADFEVSGAYERASTTVSNLQVVLFNRKTQAKSQQKHTFSSPAEITPTLRKAGSALAEEIFNSLDCKLLKSLGGPATPVSGQCYLLSFSGTSTDTVDSFEDPIHGKAPGVGQNQTKNNQRHQGEIPFVVSSEVVDPMKYAHLATPGLVNAGNQMLSNMKQHFPGATQIEQDLRQVLPPDDKPYQSIWGDGQYEGQLMGFASHFTIAGPMGQEMHREGSSGTGRGKSHVKGRLVQGMAYLDLSCSAEAAWHGKASQSLQIDTQKMSVPWEPLLNQPGQVVGLGFPSVPFKIPLQDGATTTANYMPSLAMPGMGQGKFEHRINVRIKRLPDSDARCKQAKSISDPDKAMRGLLDMMGPNAGKAFEQLLAPGATSQPGTGSGMNSGGGWQQQAAPPPVQPNTYYYQPQQPAPPATEPSQPSYESDDGSEQPSLRDTFDSLRNMFGF